MAEAPPGRLLIFGLGYSGSAIGQAAGQAGYSVTGTSRQAGHSGAPGVTLVPFEVAEAAIAEATHILATAAPDEAGDPALARYGAAIAAAPALRWIGYLSSTGVYGDRGGAWVDEASVPAPTSRRARARRAAEVQWEVAAAGRDTPLDIMRLAGIYGPGRSVLDELRAGRGRRIDKPGHAFGRIFRADIAGGTLAAMRSATAGTRVLNFNDDLPTEPALVVEEAARLLGLPPPPLIPFAEAEAGMTPMGRSFWAESRRVRSAATQRLLGYAWRFPTYREGLRCILDEERRATPPIISFR
jgi:nucleoside-diphosphate-sugar epimerase